MKLIMAILMMVILTACNLPIIPTPTPPPTPVVKPAGNPPMPFEGPFPNCIDEYLDWVKGYKLDWYNWLIANKGDVPLVYSNPCGTPVPIPTPVTPAPIPDPKPWWDYPHVIPTQVTGLGSPSQPVPIVDYCSGVAGWGFNRYYCREHTIPQGKIVSFKVDPMANVPGYTGDSIKVFMINYEAYRTNVYKAIVYKVTRASGVEVKVSELLAGQNFQTSVILPYAAGYWYRVELYEDGMQSTPVSVWWTP